MCVQSDHRSLGEENRSADSDTQAGDMGSVQLSLVMDISRRLPVMDQSLPLSVGL